MRPFFALPCICLALSAQGDPTPQQIVQAFARQGIRLNSAEAEGIRPDVGLALREASTHGAGNSKVDFAAVEISSMLGLDSGDATRRRILAAIGDLGACAPARPFVPVRPLPPPPPPPPTLEWDRYFDETLGLWNRPEVMDLLQRQSFFPVKISWEDIGRDENSVWGDRISDVGIWVRRRESAPGSAELALSVRRDSNFRDKVLMVPAEKIKVHLRQGWCTVERTLPERLRELGLASATRDRNVIVSNQFAIVPVPSRAMGGRWGAPPRVAFNFSIYPYGSTNFVITDVIEGSSEAVVGPGTHQMLYADIGGRKAPFTASRAEDRQDLLRMERELKAQGMDVDVQRYYLIQVPLRPGARVGLSNMGTPPMQPAFGGYYPAAPSTAQGMEDGSASGAGAPSVKTERERASGQPGLSRVAIGHGEAEGAYAKGWGFAGQRAEEPIRVTVVYFVTPVGPVTGRDMEAFSRAFAQWDGQAIWGGSFVTKQTF